MILSRIVIVMAVIMAMGSPCSAQAATFKATGPTNETYDFELGLAPEVEVTFSNVSAETHFQLPFYALMIPGQIASGDDCMYFNGWAEGYDAPSENSNWRVPGNQYEPLQANDPGFAHCAFWIESQNPARIVVRHRYPLIRNSVIYNQGWTNPIGKQGEWVDQWFIISPDGTHIKKTRVYTQDATSCYPWVPPVHDDPDDRSIEVEGMYMMSFLRPNHTVADDLETNYWTLIKMNGSAKDVPQDYSGATFEENFRGFDNANIQLINTEATSSLDPYRIGRYSGCFNSAYTSDLAESNDPIPHRRFLGPTSYHNGGVGDLYMYTHWRVQPNHSVTEIWLNGYTSAGDAGGKDGGEDAGPELAKIARSWNHAPTLTLSNGATNASYCFGQRAFLLHKSGNDPVRGTIAASSRSPLVNPTFLIKDWGNGGVNLSLGDAAKTEGIDYHVGYYPTLTFEDDSMAMQTWNDVLIVWVEADTTSNTELILAPGTDAPVITQGDRVDVTIDENETSVPWVPPTVTATNPLAGTMTWSLAIPPAHGTAIVNGTGTTPTTLDYAPDSNHSGTDSFVVQVSNETAIDMITVHITITDYPDPPTAVDDVSITPMNVLRDIDVLANDYDIDGNPLTISAVGTPSYGSIVNHGSRLTYTPGSGIDGVTDVFTYTINDGTGRTDDGTVSVTIGGGPIGDFSTNLVVNFAGSDTVRNFTVHVPDSYDGSPIPLLLMFANVETLPSEVITQSDWSTTADVNGFIVIYPEALEGIRDHTGDGVPDRAWDIDFGGIGTDTQDRQFVVDLLDWAEANYNVRTTHVFSAGFSVGGVFSYYITTELYPRIMSFSEQTGGFAKGTGWFWPSEVPAASGFSGYILHSPTDEYVDPSNADLLFSEVTSKGHRAFLDKFSGKSDPGHNWAPSENQAQWDFFMDSAYIVNGPVPTNWLAAQNGVWTSNFETIIGDDPDEDGFTTLQEYRMGTDPRSDNSFPHIDDIQFDGSGVTLTWRNARVDTPPPAIVIQGRSNLSTGSWFYAGQKAAQNGINTWSKPTLQSTFYRIVSTNAP